MSITDNTELTPREYVLMENERDENRLIREHAEAMKKLDIQFQREKLEAEVQLQELQVRWSNWLRIPLLILKLPVYVLLGLGYIVLCITKQKPTQAFWDFIK